MVKKNNKLKLAQEKAEKAIKYTNSKIEELGENTSDLHNALTEIQNCFDIIRNIPTKEHLEYQQLKNIRLNWKQQVDEINSNYEAARIKAAGKGIAGIGTGAAVAALGPTAAMGIATTFGVASTGTAISALSGAAATNAALAWLGGGALAAGGGGMAAGNAFLALAGPLGWAIAGISIIGTGFLYWKAKSDQTRREDIFSLICERDVTFYNLATVELNERITRIKNDVPRLNSAIADIKTFGTDYDKMSEVQQYSLGTYVNLMSASTQLLVNPILGLQPKFSEFDYNNFVESNHIEFDTSKFKNLIISLANLLYKIEFDEKDKNLLYKSFRKNKVFLSSMGINKNEFNKNIFDIVCYALEFKYQSVTL